MSYFAAFVGLSASGKTTAIEACRQNLTNEGMRVAAFHERKSDPECILVDEFVATNQNRLSPESRMNLFIAIRQIAVRNVIKPSLAVNDVTLLDRFWPCTVAYQAYGEGLDVDKVTFCF
jgi:dTMP kinase